MNPDESFMTGYAAGFTQALALIEARHRETAVSAIDCFKHDEHVACTDATVLIDERGEIAWINNLRAAGDGVKKRRRFGRETISKAIYIRE